MFTCVETMLQADCTVARPRDTRQHGPHSGHRGLGERAPPNCTGDPAL